MHSVTVFVPISSFGGRETYDTEPVLLNTTLNVEKTLTFAQSFNVEKTLNGKQTLRIEQTPIPLNNHLTMNKR